MAGYKGVGIVFVRAQVRAARCEDAVLESLSPGARDTWRQATAGGWYPMEHAIEMFTRAAPLLFPGSPSPLRELGRAMAQDNLGGVYRHIVRLLSVPFLIKQTMVFWRLYHNAGRATCTSQEKSAVVTLYEYPDCPERFRECLCGWIAGAVEVCGGTNARVLKEDGDPFVWRVTWK